MTNIILQTGSPIPSKLLRMVGYLASRALRQSSANHFLQELRNTEPHTTVGLLAAVTAQLLVFFKGAAGSFKSEDDPRKEPVLRLTYVALILRIGAAISSLILTDEFADTRSCCPEAD